MTAAGSAVNVHTGNAGALLHAWYPGSEGGKALAEILFGDISPSGKLPVTFYESAEKLPDFRDYSMKNRTYRFAQDNVLYPFGFGLTYGNVKCTSVSFESGTARVTAENSGSRASEDVIQLYLKDTSEYAVPNVSLCGFKRVSLAAGESAVIEIPVSERSFTAVGSDGERKIFGKRFTLYAGTSQPDTVSRSLGFECASTEIEL